MQCLQAISRQPRGFVIGFMGASALFLLVFGLAFSNGKIMASHDTSGSVHACVSRYTGQTRIMLPGRPPNCTTGEALVEWAGSSVVADLETRIAALEAQVPDCMATEGSDAVFEVCNVHVRNGMGSTATTNGAGNLIVGYNEDDGSVPDRGGSNYLVVGTDNGYSSYGGLVAGESNTVTGPYASVTGGRFNTASGVRASVSGGSTNDASGPNSSISGGGNNVASGTSASVTGGTGNIASGTSTSVLGGTLNLAAGHSATVSGGSDNAANGPSSSVSGGRDGIAPEIYDWVAGSLFEDF